MLKLIILFPNKTFLSQHFWGKKRGHITSKNQKFHKCKICNICFNTACLFEVMCTLFIYLETPEVAFQNFRDGGKTIVLRTYLNLK